ITCTFYSKTKQTDSCYRKVHFTLKTMNNILLSIFILVVILTAMVPSCESRNIGCIGIRYRQRHCRRSRQKPAKVHFNGRRIKTKQNRKTRSLSNQEIDDVIKQIEEISIIR
uniref:Uncharacterized protein n=1 Tax=Clytia hemisphaerica TaxID=252671 RepID=A0A7M5UKU6_9CNID